MGVPPILMDSGNNANIRPNHRLYYLETILPIVRKINFAFERFFGFTIKEDFALPNCDLKSEPEEQKGTMTFSTCHANEAKEPHFYIVNSKGWLCQSCPFLYIDKEHIRVAKLYEL